MPEPGTDIGLLRLMTWLSPAFPVGGFSYSHGLETAVHRTLADSAEDLRAWLAGLLTHGSAWNDAVLFAEAHRRARSPDDHDLTGPPVDRASPADSLVSLSGLAEALAGSHERHMETMLQGAAFLKAATAWPHPVLAALPEDCAYPVAVGAVCGAHGMPLGTALAAYLQAFVSNQVQAAIRLSVFGQADAMMTLAALEPVIARTAGRAATSTLDDLGAATVIAEIVAMQHETHHSRLFRT